MALNRNCIYQMALALEFLRQNGKKEEKENESCVPGEMCNLIFLLFGTIRMGERIFVEHLEA